MQMRFQFNGRWLVLDEVGLGDLVAFERHFGVSSSVLEPKTVPVVDPVTGDTKVDPLTGEIEQELAPGVEMKMEWLAFLAYRQARREGAIAKDAPFDEDFIDGLGGMEQDLADETDKEDPEDPQAGASQAS